MNASALDNTPPGSRIAVALSGGVDSAVVAALLKEQGFEVIALTMRLQKSDTPDDAVRVAQSLSIPHEIIDLTEAFSAEVMDYFAATYAAGETPSPCVRCNRLIKFGRLMETAKARGAQALATGHYACRIDTPHGAELHKGSDPVRDQSYFLSALTQAQIDFMRAPLGAMDKKETRALAQRYSLPVAQKKDSQDICFVPDGDYAAVLKRLNPTLFKSGAIVDQTGHILGQHNGIAHFTVGQRKGLNIGDRSGENNAPLFVTALDAAQNRVIVGPREALAKTTVFLKDVNWLGAHCDLDVEVKLRSAQPPAPARLLFDKDGACCATLTLEQPAYGVAKGQIAALYNGERLMGGGRICGAQ